MIYAAKTRALVAKALSDHFSPPKYTEKSTAMKISPILMAMYLDQCVPLYRGVPHNKRFETAAARIRLIAGFVLTHPKRKKIDQTHNHAQNMYW